MDQARPTDVPNPEEQQKQEREDAVDIVLDDMDKYFPNGMGPETWTAVRDYMLIRLNQFPNIDNQLRLYTSLEAVHREGTTQLSNLAQVACDLAEAMDVRGPVEQAVLHALDYSPASFLEITWQLTALEVRRVQHQADHLAVCNENEILRQRLFQADALLQRREEDLDLAREMVRAREEGLQRFREVLREKGEELRRTGHILERVEAERDRASNTAEYLRLQLGDLESRLKESQKLRSSAEGCFQSLMSALSKQRVSHGPQARPVVALESAPVTGMSPFAGLPHDHRPMATHSANPESRWAGLFEENAATEAQESEDIPVAMEVAPMTNGDAPVKAPMRPNQVIPAVPKLPPNEVMRANSAKNLEEELDKAEEKVSLPSRATSAPTQVNTSSKAENDPHIQPHALPSAGHGTDGRANRRLQASQRLLVEILSATEFNANANPGGGRQTSGTE